MSNTTPPSLDPNALMRFRAQQSLERTAWLHGEVARRMEQRLDWFKEKPKSWIDWEPVNGGTEAHSRIQTRYPGADALIVEFNERRLLEAKKVLKPNWLKQCLRLLQHGNWNLQTYSIARAHAGAQVDFLWANMLLHLAPNPTELIKEWHKSLRVGGWVMFSCLGPDTSIQLREIYEKLGWGAPSHEFTDMHDWGDMLVEAGFADPVMDMERITLTYSTPDALIKDLRTLGRNFNNARFKALKGRGWFENLKTQLIHLSNSKNTVPGVDSTLKIPLTFEIIYGHAFKVAPKIKVTGSASFSEEDMRSMLKGS